MIVFHSDKKEKRKFFINGKRSYYEKGSVKKCYISVPDFKSVVFVPLAAVLKVTKKLH